MRHPVSLKKIMYIKEKGNILYHTKYNGYWKENIKLFKVSDFIAELTMHIPPKHKHLIRYYGCIPAGRRVRPLKKGALQSLGIIPHPKRKLPKPMILRVRVYRTRLQNRAGHDSFRKSTRPIH